MKYICGRINLTHCNQFFFVQIKIMPTFKVNHNFTIFFTHTVVPVMNGHPHDQAKVSVHCSGRSSQGRTGKRGTPTLQYYIILSPPAIFLMNTRIVIITRRQHGNLRDLSVASLGARQRFLVEMATENVAFVCTVRYSRC